MRQYSLEAAVGFNLQVHEYDNANLASNILLSYKLSICMPICKVG
jgi:hypothetical protein